MGWIEKDHCPWNTRANDTGSFVECFSQFIEGGAFYRLPAMISQLTIVRASTYSPHSRRYGVTITGLLVTVFHAGQNWEQDQDRLCVSLCLSRHVIIHVQVPTMDTDMLDWQTKWMFTGWLLLHHLSIVDNAQYTLVSTQYTLAHTNRVFVSHCDWQANLTRAVADMCTGHLRIWMCLHVS